MDSSSDGGESPTALLAEYTMHEDLPPPPTTTYVANKPSAFSLLLDSPETWAAAAEGVYGQGVHNQSGQHASKLPGQRGGSSRYRGVSWYKTARKWVAQISIDGKPTFLGYFENEVDAARKFDEHAAKYGRKLNWPQETLVESRRHSSFPMPSATVSKRFIPRQQDGAHAAVPQLPCVPCELTTLAASGSLSLSLSSSSSSSTTSSEASSPQPDTAAHDYDDTIDAGMSAALKSLSSPKKSKASSQYKGVSWSRAAQKWKAEIYIDGKSNYLGHFENEEVAARKYDALAAGLNRSLNFPGDASAGRMLPPAAAHKKHASLSVVSTGSASSMDQHNPQPMGRSQYVGVSWYHSSQKWRAQITVNGAPKYLGSFDSEVEAAKKYDEFAKVHGKPVNLPQNASEERAAKTTVSDPQREFIDRGPSRFVGVRWHRANQKWTSYIRVAGKQMALGAFEDEEAAARKYDEYAARHGRPLNFPHEVSAKVTTNSYSGSTKRPGPYDGMLEDEDALPVVAQATKRNKTKGSVVSSVSTGGANIRFADVGDGDIVLALLEHQWWPCEVGTSLAYFGDCLSGLSDADLTSLTAHSGYIAKIFASSGESPRFIAVASADGLRIMSSAERAPRCASAALKEAYVEARHCMLTMTAVPVSTAQTTASFAHPEHSAFGSRWQDIAASVGAYNGDEGDDQSRVVDALSLLANASAEGQRSSVSEAAQLMTAMKRSPSGAMPPSPAASSSTGMPPPDFFSAAQEPGGPPPQFAAI